MGQRILRGRPFAGEVWGCVRDLFLIANSGHIQDRLRGLSRHHLKPVFEHIPDRWHHLLAQMSGVMALMHHLAGLLSSTVGQTSC